MKRAEFTGLFLGLIVQKIPTWTPEEATEEYMLDTMLANIERHRKQIREVLMRNGDKEIPSTTIQVAHKPCRRTTVRPD